MLDQVEIFHGLSDEELKALDDIQAEAHAAMAAGDIERLHRACEIFRNSWIAAVPNVSLRKALQRYMDNATCQKKKRICIIIANAYKFVRQDLTAQLATEEDWIAWMDSM